jgi:hypothetical protein
MPAVRLYETGNYVDRGVGRRIADALLLDRRLAA